MLHALRNSWEKNWPEIHAGLTGGLPEFVLARRPRELGSMIPVFCYHLLDSATFNADLDFLSENRYSTIDAATLLKHLAGSGEVPERAVVLTIDDGARNLFEVGFPTLQRHGMKAVAFISPRFHPFEEPTFSSDRYPPPCSWHQIRAMHQSGHLDFQSHGYEHRYIPRWPEPVDMTGIDPDWVEARRRTSRSIAEDLRLAKETLEEQLAKPIEHLAFVKYKGTEPAVRIGRECGYRAFWWGYLPYHTGNVPGQSPDRISRIDGIFLRRLPGNGRLPLTSILRRKHAANLARLWLRTGARATG